MNSFKVLFMLLLIVLITQKIKSNECTYDSDCGGVYTCKTINREKVCWYRILRIV